MVLKLESTEGDLTSKVRSTSNAAGWCGPHGRPLSLRVFGCLPVTGEGLHGGRRPKSLEGGNRGGEYAPAAVSVYGDLRRDSARLGRSRTELPAGMGSGVGDF